MIAPLSAFHLDEIVGQFESKRKIRVSDRVLLNLTQCLCLKDIAEM